MYARRRLNFAIGLGVFALLLGKFLMLLADWQYSFLILIYGYLTIGCCYPFYIVENKTYSLNRSIKAQSIILWAFLSVFITIFSDAQIVYIVGMANVSFLVWLLAFSYSRLFIKSKRVLARNNIVQAMFVIGSIIVAIGLLAFYIKVLTLILGIVLFSLGGLLLLGSIYLVVFSAKSKVV